MAERRRRTPYIKGDTWTRFWAKVQLGPVNEWRPELGPCWVWAAAKTQGYGIFATTPGCGVRAHRWAYRVLRGGLDPALDLDHLCATRSCVNPSHLEAVLTGENTRRQVARHMQLGTWHRTGKTHCKRGHLYTDATTKRDGQGKRSCRICNNARRRAQHQPRPACPNGHLYTTTTTPGRHRRCVICHPTKAEQAA